MTGCVDVAEAIISIRSLESIQSLHTREIALTIGSRDLLTKPGVLSLRSRRLLVQIGEPGMLERSRGTDAIVRAKLQHGIEQTKANMIDNWEIQSHILNSVLLEAMLILGKGGDSWPSTFGRSAHQPKDLLQLVLIRCAREERSACEHLSHDAARGPDVDTRIVLSAAQEYIGRSVP